MGGPLASTSGWQHRGWNWDFARPKGSCDIFMNTVAVNPRAALTCATVCRPYPSIRQRAPWLPPSTAPNQKQSVHLPTQAHSLQRVALSRTWHRRRCIHFGGDPHTLSTLPQRQPFMLPAINESNSPAPIYSLAWKCTSRVQSPPWSPLLFCTMKERFFLKCAFVSSLFLSVLCEVSVQHSNCHCHRVSRGMETLLSAGSQQVQSERPWAGECV